MKKHDPNDTSENKIIGFTGGWVDLNKIPISERWRNLPTEKRTETVRNKRLKVITKQNPQNQNLDFALIIVTNFRLRKRRGRHQWRWLNAKYVVASSHDYIIAQRRLISYIKRVWK